jgi:hypothetical protein
LWVEGSSANDLGHNSEIDYSLTLDGSNDHLVHNGPVIPTEGEFVVEAWVFDQRTNTEGTSRIVSQGIAAGETTVTNPGGFDIMTRASTVPGHRAIAVFYKCQTSCQLIETDVVIPNNSWKHIALVTDDSNSRFQLYVNGKLAFTSATLSTSPMPTSATFFLGRPWRDNVAGSRFKGKIDEVNVWTKPGAGTDFETWIQGHMHNYVAKDSTGLLSRYDCEKCIDYRGNCLCPALALDPEIETKLHLHSVGYCPKRVVKTVLSD